MSETSEATGGPPPFIRDTIDEARSFVQTAASFARHPLRFSRAWASGETKAMNPIGFFGAAVGLRFGAEAIAEHLRGPARQAADIEKLHAVAPTLFWLGDLLSQQIPLATAVLFALVIHQRLRKRSGQPFTASLGVVLFAEGIESIGRAAVALATFRWPEEIVGQPFDNVIGLVELVLLGFALAGVHRLKGWMQSLGPMLLGCLAIALAAGLVLAPIGFLAGKQAQREKGATDLSLRIGRAKLEIKNDGAAADAGVSPVVIATAADAGAAAVDAGVGRTPLPDAGKR